MSLTPVAGDCRCCRGPLQAERPRVVVVLRRANEEGLIASRASADATSPALSTHAVGHEESRSGSISRPSSLCVRTLPAWVARPYHRHMSVSPCGAPY
jgi:hypothetical protein